MDIPTLINSSARIKGELMFSCDVRIDGEVYGKVESDKSAIIGAAGYVKGFLRARDLVVFGRIEGNIIISGTTVLHPGSSIYGNLYTRGIEVNEGANITARVITYDKLESFDEAQIHLAQEMISIQQGKKNKRAYLNSQLAFEDYTKVPNVHHEHISFRHKELSVDLESNDKNGANQLLFSHSPVDKVEIVTDEKAACVFSSEIESDVAVNEFVSSSAPEMFEEMHHSGPEITVGEAESPLAEQNSGSATNSAIQSATPEDSIDYYDRKTISLASFLGQPVKDDDYADIFFRTGKKKAYKPEATIAPQATRKFKASTILGIEDIRNILNHAKYPKIIGIEKKIVQIKYKNLEIADNEASFKINGSEKGKFSLNDAISQLPADDYSSLFK